MKIEINGLKFELSTTSKTFLEKYLERMEHFIKQNDIEIEVYDDIEERIAEKFTENLSNKKTKKIEDKTVIDIVNEIGEPTEILEELIDNDYETTKTENKKTTSFKKHFEAGEHSLTRNSKEGILFGVCYGIGSRYNIDPLWIRLAFVLGTIFRGMTIVLYIVLVFLLPNESKKKDNSIIEEVEDLTDNFVTDIKEATDKIDVEKYKKKFSFRKKTPLTPTSQDGDEKVPEKKKTKNIPSEVKKKNEKVETKKEKRNIFVRFIVFIFVSIKSFFIFLYYLLKYIVVFSFHLFRYILAFALLAGTVPVLVALVFVTGITFTTFQFDNQALFAHFDLFLKIGIVGILSSLLFLLFGIFLKLLKSKALSNGLMITGIMGIFTFAFVGGLGFFSTFNEYKNIYTKTEILEFDNKDFVLKDIDLFGENDSLIEGLNWIEGIFFEESIDDKIRVEITTVINSKSKITSEQIFSELTEIETIIDNGVEISVGNKSTFKKIVPYSFLRREVKVYIPKEVKIQIGIGDKDYRTNLGIYNEEEKKVRGAYGIRNCENKYISYNKEIERFICE